MKKAKVSKNLILVSCLCLTMIAMAVMATFTMTGLIAPNASITASASSVASRDRGLNFGFKVLSYVNENGSLVSADPEASNITDTGEGWAWYRNGVAVDGKSYSGLVLVLSGANIDGAGNNGITVPANTTIVSKYGTTSNIRSSLFVNGGGAAAIFPSPVQLHLTAGA